MSKRMAIHSPSPRESSRKEIFSQLFHSKNSGGIYPVLYKKAKLTYMRGKNGRLSLREFQMSCRQLLEVRSEDRTPHKWSVSLREDVFDSFLSRGGNTLHKVFGQGSLFSPLLFGKFFDPSDAFPLWDFEAEALLSGLHGSSGTSVDWFTTDTEYVLKAGLPGLKNQDVQICVDSGKVVEISGQWRQRESDAKDWKTGHWWEYGYVRRLELPENANWKSIEANIDEEHVLEIRIPKNVCDPNSSKEMTGPKESELV